MDFSLMSQPRLAYAPPENLSPTGKDYWLYWAHQVGNIALPASGLKFLQAGRLFSFSFKMRPLPTLVKYNLPFTLSVVQPGIIHLAIDVGFYRPGEVLYAFRTIDEQYRLLSKWFSTVDDSYLKTALGPFDFDRLTDNGLIKDFRAVVEMPPAWLTDP